MEHLDEQEKIALIDALADLHRDEEQAKHLNDGIKSRRDRIKAYHDRHPEEPIADYERGYAASFTERSGSASIDLISLADNCAEPAHVLLALARAGLLSCSVTGLRRLAGKAEWADLALKYEMPGSAQTVLSITKID